ncbi:MAG: hypothetical protein H0U70_04960 [Tatlockia sp.]|nr:hypothetical protein [Tatlockia sp.]
MEFYDDRPANLERDFYRLRITASEDTKRIIRSIFKNLNIPRSEWVNYSPKLTVYEFLEKLAQDGHQQVDFIIRILDKKSRFSKFGLALGAGVLLSFLLYVVLQPPFQFVIDTLVHFFSMIISFPIISLISNCGLFCFYIIQSHYDGKKTDFNRFRDNAFIIMSFSATTGAYIILVCTAAAMTPVIAGLYVAAAAIDVIREIFCLAQEYFVYLTGPPFDEDDQLSMHRTKAQRDFGFEKRRNILGFNVVAGVLIIAITALWCFLPGGMPATIFALTAIGLVHLIKNALIKWNEAHLREQLQERLQELEIHYAETHPEQNPDKILSPLKEFHSEKKDGKTLQNQLELSTSAGKRPFFSPYKPSKPIIEEFSSDESADEYGLASISYGQY